MHFFKNTKYDFMGKRKLWYIISIASVVIGMSVLGIRGLTYGVDFLGGTELIVEFSQSPSTADIRTAMANAGIPRAEIKEYGTANRILLRTEQQGEGATVRDKINAVLQQAFPEKHPIVLGGQTIGPKIGKELRRDAFLAVLFSMLAMLVYIGFRFKLIYGVGAVVAMAHDVLATIGLIAIINKLTPWTDFEMDQNMIAAFLTLIGLSVNDTVVIFDRIRENQKIHRTMELGELMNMSINQTLSRTVITSGLIFLVTIVLFIFGGEVNRGFAFTLSFGILTGTYSSIYVASAIVLDYARSKDAKKHKSVASEKLSYETLDQRS